MNANKRNFPRTTSFSLQAQQPISHAILCPKPIKLRKNLHKTSPVFQMDHGYNKALNTTPEKTNSTERNNLILISPVSSVSDEIEASEKKSLDLIHSLLLLRQEGENPLNRDPFFCQELGDEGDINFDL